LIAGIILMLFLKLAARRDLAAGVPDHADRSGILTPKAVQAN